MDRTWAFGQALPWASLGLGRNAAQWPAGSVGSEQDGRRPHPWGRDTEHHPGPTCLSEGVGTKDRATPPGSLGAHPGAQPQPECELHGSTSGVPLPQVQTTAP